MPLQVICPSCSTKLKAPDTAAGKKTKCPKCQAVVTVPVDAPQATAETSAKSTAGTGKGGGTKTGKSLPKAKADNWFMQTPDGNQYGPVARVELNQWHQEGRITSECQLLKEGADQWQWANEIYPDLESTAPASAPTKPTTDQQFGLDPLGASTGLVPLPHDPLGLAGAAGGVPAFNPAPMMNTGYGVPSAYGGGYGAASTLGGGGYGGSYGGSSYGAQTNPYASPASSSYGPRRRGGSAHPMVIIAAILHFFIGGLGLLVCIGALVVLTAFAVGGTSAISGSEDPSAMPAFAAIAGMGLLCAFVVLIPAILWAILELFVGTGLLKRRTWARITAIIIAALRLLFALIGLFFSLLSLNIVSGIMNFISLAIAIFVLVVMLIPDPCADFT